MLSSFWPIGLCFRLNHQDAQQDGAAYPPQGVGSADPRGSAKEMNRERLIEAEISFTRGSRPQLPTGSGYAPHFVVNGDQTWLGVRFLDCPSDMQFGKPFRVTVELLYPDSVDYSLLHEGAIFDVREGSKIVATGRVLSTTK